MILLQFALSTDDPYPSSNWIIVLHAGLSVEKLEFASFNSGEVNTCFESGEIFTYSDSFYLGEVLEAWKKFGELRSNLLERKEDRERIDPSNYEK